MGLKIMLRELDIPMEEILIDERAVSERINDVLDRYTLRIAGAGQVGGHLLVFAESAGCAEVCRIAPFAGFSGEELLSEVRGRYDADFSTVALWEYDNRFWGLVVRAAKKEVA